MVRAFNTCRDQAVEFGHGFYDVDRGVGGDDAVEFEAGLLEERGEGVTRGSADVGDVGGGETVVGCDGGRIGAVEVDEEVAERGGFFGIAGQVVEEGDAEVVIERGLAGLDGAGEFGPRDPEEISGDGEDGCADGAGTWERRGSASGVSENR
jgi:hypothetical protein